ncbi:MAG: hypothetical protein J6Y91_05020 [Alphaproteobacteria bacterium]|nr:hypothetical protein [Alphaproteobacteria bacterium]
MSDNMQDMLNDSDDDFEKLLNNFISDGKNEESEEDKKEEENTTFTTIGLTAEEDAANAEAAQLLEQEMYAALDDARKIAEEEKNKPVLGNDESELAQAFVNFYTAVNNLAKTHLQQDFICNFSIDNLYPNYKPSIGQIISQDLINGWMLLVKMFPEEIGNFPSSSSDEEFLNLAEKLKNQDLQLAVISYVEILIDMEGCELSYRAKYLQYQEKHIKRIMYEEYLARKERQAKFTAALQQKNFPVDADRLISNYFRVAQKDVDGAFKALTTNPAIFAPIDFSKIKPRFFGLIKVSPKDGIRINMQIGDFLKKLKV